MTRPFAPVYLLYQMTRASFLGQEKNSALGMLWHLVNPLAMALVIYAVFSRFSAFGEIPYYPLSILVGILHFNFLTQAGARAAEGMLHSRSLVLSTAVPHELIVLRSLCVDALTFLVELVLLLALIALLGPGLTWNALAIGIVVIGLGLLTAGVAFVLASAVVFLTDLLYVWGVGSRMLFFLTPIFYTPEMLSDPTAEAIVGLNPLGFLIGMARRCLLEGQALGAAEISAALRGPAVVFAIGLAVFRRLDRSVPDFI